MLVVIMSLKELHLPNCDIIDNGILYICEGLTINQTLSTLNIRDNCQITSVSFSTIADLIQTAAILTVLYLYNTSLNDDDIKIICASLTEILEFRNYIYQSNMKRIVRS